jgi:hypothetical protein
MRIGFLSSDKPREHLLADAFLLGARRHGHKTEVLPLTGEPFVGNYDVACMVGVKSRDLFHAHQVAGCRVIYLDKGYCRQKAIAGGHGWEYWRVSLNDHHPSRRLGELRQPSDRWDQLGLAFKPWRRQKSRGAILLAGSSAKYHDFYGLRDPNGWARRTVNELEPYAHGRSFVYRPKPSWHDGAPISNAEFSGPTEVLSKHLVGAYALVTHGSNACFEAVLEGVPSLILGNGVARPISSTAIPDLEKLRLATDAERQQWLANIAYFQWTLHEMSRGDAWDFISSEIYA